MIPWKGIGGQIMKNIFKGPVRKVVVSKLELKNGLHKLADYDTPIIKEDLLFYRGIGDSYISFDYGTIIPDQHEAIDFIEDTITSQNVTEEPFPSCFFVNNSEIELSHQLSNKEFKTLKKEFKQRRKLMQQEKK